MASLAASPTVAPALTARSCEICGKKDHLFKCQACQAVYYCDLEHQAADRPRHEARCSIIGLDRAELDRQRRRLRHMPEDSDHPGNLFETSPGHFMEIPDAILYIGLRSNLVESLLEHFGYSGGHLEVVEEALDHVMDMMFLTGLGTLKLRPYAVALQLRLGKIQEAYNFCKWWTTARREDGSYNRLELLDNANLLEPISLWATRGTELGPPASVALIKARLLLDLQSLQSVNQNLRRILPQEIIDTICTQLGVGVLASLPELAWASTEELSTMIRTVQAQLRSLYDFIDGRNRHLWYLLLERGSEAARIPSYRYVDGSEKEARVVASHMYAAWSEVPRATALMKDLRRHVKGLSDTPEVNETELH